MNVVINSILDDVTLNSLIFNKIPLVTLRKMIKPAKLKVQRSSMYSM